MTCAAARTDDEAVAAEGESRAGIFLAAAFHASDLMKSRLSVIVDTSIDIVANLWEKNLRVIGSETVFFF